MLSPPEPTRHCCPLELTTPPPPPSPLCLSLAPLCVCSGGSGRLWVRPGPPSVTAAAAVADTQQVV